MAKQAREKSPTGIYHVILRGIDKRNIFLDDEDKMKFTEDIEKAKKVGKSELWLLFYGQLLSVLLSGMLGGIIKSMKE